MAIAWVPAINTTTAKKDIDTEPPRVGIRPCYSGLQIQGTATSPSSTTPKPSGGDERTRTADPLVANEVLSQLSYIPTYLYPDLANGGERGIRTPGALAHSTVFETAPFNRSGISPRVY